MLLVALWWISYFACHWSLILGLLPTKASTVATTIYFLIISCVFTAMYLNVKHDVGKDKKK